MIVYNNTESKLYRTAAAAVVSSSSAAPDPVPAGWQDFQLELPGPGHQVNHVFYWPIEYFSTAFFSIPFLALFFFLNHIDIENIFGQVVKKAKTEDSST